MSELPAPSLVDEQRDFWNGKAGERWAQSQPELDQALDAYGELALQRLRPQPEERILDIGCGSGTSTLQLAQAVGPVGRIVGLDISRPLLDLARARLNAFAQVQLIEGDAAEYELLGEAPFHALYSRFGVMFFARPVAAFARLRSCLVLGGRLCFVCWRAWTDNEWLTRVLESFADLLPEPYTPPADTTQPGEFGLARADHVGDVLTRAGFEQVQIEPVDLPVVFSRNGVQDALQFVTRVGPLARLIADQSAPRAELIRQRLSVLLAEIADGPQVQLPGAGWLVSAEA